MHHACLNSAHQDRVPGDRVDRIITGVGSRTRQLKSHYLGSSLCSATSTRATSSDSPWPLRVSRATPLTPHVGASLAGIGRLGQGRARVNPPVCCPLGGMEAGRPCVHSAGRVSTAESSSLPEREVFTGSPHGSHQLQDPVELLSCGWPVGAGPTGR